MALHFRGEHKACSHVDLPADHPAVRCEAQRRYLAEVLHSLSECMGDILTPFGAMDMNGTESLHAVLRRYRPKGEKWGAVQCFLGETLGSLHWQRLQQRRREERVVADHHRPRSVRQPGHLCSDH